jgi:hypothetical protein
MDYEQKYLKYKSKYLNLLDQIASGCGETSTYNSGTDKEKGTYTGCMTGIVGYRKRHGQGKMIYRNGDYFEGEWVSDYFEGEWLDDKIKKGKGKLTYENKYSNGETLNLKYPTYKYTYTGDVTDGKRHGKGKIIINNNKFYYYYGDWQDDKRHGQGIMMNENNDVLNGTWENDQIKHGVLIFSNMEVRKRLDWTIHNKLYDNHFDRFNSMDLSGTYTGDFVDNKRHGKGKMIYDINRPTVDINGVSKFKIRLVSFSGEWTDNKWKTGTLTYINYENKQYTKQISY